MAKRSSEREWLPWYREPGYKGNLTEKEKRMLDSFRSQPKHPAATYADLPDEVQSYISGASIELLDAKRDLAMGGAAFATVALGAFLFAQYEGCISGSVWTYPLFGAGILYAWFDCNRKLTRIYEEFTPSRKNAPSGTDEAIRKEWELEYLTRRDERSVFNDGGSS